jgi:hypothetical protein
VHRMVRIEKDSEMSSTETNWTSSPSFMASQFRLLLRPLVVPFVLLVTTIVSMKFPTEMRSADTENCLILLPYRTAEPCQSSNLRLHAVTHHTLSPIIDFFNIFRPVFYLKTTFRRLYSVSVLKQKPGHLNPVDKANPYLRTEETESNLRNIIFI